MPLSVVILAAGQGKRMNSDLPKVLQPLAGKPLLQHVIDTALSLKPEGIYVVYGSGGAQVKAALSEAPVQWVLQAEQLGTGHAVMRALPLIPDGNDVLVLYGDVPLIRTGSLQTLLAAVTRESMALLSVSVDDPTGYGRIVRSAAGVVIRIVEHRDASPTQLKIKEINTGVMAAPANKLRSWLLDLDRNNAQREYLLTDVVAIAVAARVPVTAVSAANAVEVLGVNDKIQLAEVEGHLRRERARELMLAGATIADPNRVDIRGEVNVGRDVYIDVNSVFVGAVNLGKGVKIGPNCLIIDSTIGAGAEINANSVIDNAVVGADCRVGPFARLRPQTVLHAQVHIGNFVEVKNSQIGPDSKANHLSYIGDATVGRGVNIGAGSITCNYDGQNKWPTIIDDGAFIGSGSMLVAPVRIGAGATIGAGSTITAPAADGKLTLERSTQVTVDPWKRPEKLDEHDKAARIETAMKNSNS